MARVLVTEEIAETGLDLLHAAGHEVDVRSGLDADGLVAALDGASALIIRSATQVTAEVLDAVEGLVVVGRAGIGLDNVDVRAATRRGVMVVNAPLSNSVSAAEHTMALLLAQARNIPQAHGDLVAGEWNRSTWKGVELADKTLGIVGLGRIGRMVAERAAAFGMRIVAHDPYVAEERARRLRIEMLDLPDLVPGPTSSPCTWPGRPRPSGSSTPTCWPWPSPNYGSSTWPGGARPRRPSSTTCGRAPGSRRFTPWIWSESASPAGGVAHPRVPRPTLTSMRQTFDLLLLT